jgi:glutamate synthase domain-containing protein 3
MTGFMGQRGSIIVCGNAAEAFADSMYETVCFVGGSIKELGNDAIVQQPTAEELEFLNATLLAHKIDPKHAWTKIVSGRKLWNFDKSEMAWREAL